MPRDLKGFVGAGNGDAKFYRSLGFKLILSSMVLALVTVGVGGFVVYKISEDAIKIDAERTVRELASQITNLKAGTSAGGPSLIDTMTSLKVDKFGAAWVMDRNGFLIAHMDPKFRNMVEARTYIGGTFVNLNVTVQPIQQLGEKNIVHKAKLQELPERFDGGFGTYDFLGDRKIVAFRVLKDRGWLVAVDQPIATAFSELNRIKNVIVTTCGAIALLICGFTWFAMRIIIRPYYREQEESNRRLELMNQELESSRRKLEKAGNSLTRLYDLSIAMQYSGFLESHLPLVLGVAQERFEVDRILLLMPDDGGMLRCRASVGNVFESEEKIFVPLSETGGALARAFLEKRTIFFDGSEKVGQDMRLHPPYDQIRSLRTRAFAVFPLIANEKVLGVLGVDNKMSRRPMTREDIDAIESFSYKVASLIDTTRHFQTIKKTAEQLEIRDRLTGLFHLRHIRDIGEGLIEQSVRGKAGFVMALFYITNFKEYNELNGYQRGDFVLTKTAEILKSQEVMGVVPCRCYGATFLALMPGKGAEQGRYLADRLEKEFAQYSFYGEKRLTDGSLRMKVAVAEYPLESGMAFDDFFATLEAL